MKNRINILHLSDLHFGATETKTIHLSAFVGQKLKLDEIQSSLAKLSPHRKPDIIVVSGDIGWEGRRENYLEAKEFFEKLLKTLGLTPDRLLICPGNHDLERDKIDDSIQPPTNAQKADDLLSPNNIDNLRRPFSAYCDFYNDLRIPKLKLGEQEYCLMGQRSIEGINFIILNSAWFCRDKADRGKQYIGAPHLKIMSDCKQLIDYSQEEKEKITVCIMHHPREFFADAELNEYKPRDNTWDYLTNHSSIILAGHTHTEKPSTASRKNNAFIFTNGATFSGNEEYWNHFFLFSIDKDNNIFHRRIFEWNPGRETWGTYDENKEYDLQHLTIRPTEQKKKTEKKQQAILSVTIEEAENNYQCNPQYRINYFSWSGINQNTAPRNLASDGEEEHYYSQEKIPVAIDKKISQLRNFEFSIIELILPYSLLSIDICPWRLKQASESGIRFLHQYKITKRLVTRFYKTFSTPWEEKWRTNWKVFIKSLNPEKQTVHLMDSLTPFCKENVQDQLYYHNHVFIKCLTGTCRQKIEELAGIIVDYGIPFIFGLEPLLQENLAKENMTELITAETSALSHDQLLNKLYQWLKAKHFPYYLLIWDDPGRRINREPLETSLQGA